VQLLPVLEEALPLLLTAPAAEAGGEGQAPGQGLAGGGGERQGAEEREGVLSPAWAQQLLRPLAAALSCTLAMARAQQAALLGAAGKCGAPLAPSRRFKLLGSSSASRPRPRRTGHPPPGSPLPGRLTASAAAHSLRPSPSAACPPAAGPAAEGAAAAGGGLGGLVLDCSSANVLVLCVR
jgi:hypothetical protein